ncbi:unnamed protein product [Staurois parvus]|uniref:Uncharacterized protein n=1 Tax=Staurois parvus TaxID=386267 RepID=A0ABN9CAD0_9NEOB|nr:unnamed protein product [Staurois parvus]
MTVISMYRRELWRYDSDRYVQERSVGGMTVISMYRRGAWRGMKVIGMYRRGAWRV